MDCFENEKKIKIVHFFIFDLKMNCFENEKKYSNFYFF